MKQPILKKSTLIFLIKIFLLNFSEKERPLCSFGSHKNSLTFFL